MTTSASPSPTTTRVQWWWLAFLGFVLLQPGFDPTSTTADWVLAGAIVVVYAPIYVLGELGDERRRVKVILATLVLGLATAPLNSGAAALFIYAAAFAGELEPPARARRWVATCFALLAVVALFSTVPFPYNLPAFGIPLAFVWLVGLATMAESERTREAVRLRVDNARMQHLATMAERDRIARDLHDVLGHSLTAVVVRAQVVQRLVAEDPDRARSEAADIETAARDALAAVRETVGGYRTWSLADEVAEARSALAAAGVTLEVYGLDVDLAPPAESALALALREAVTNVVRHADAGRCRVTLVREAGELRLQVVDDGRGGGEEGIGLQGMRERIVALGGRVERTTRPGTTLTIALPSQFEAAAG